MQETSEERTENHADHNGHRYAQGRRPLAGEQVGDGGRDRDKAAEARTERDVREGQVQVHEGIDAAKTEIAEAKEADADLHYGFAAVALDQPALQRAEDAAFGADNRADARYRCPTPAELGVQG